MKKVVAVSGTRPERIKFEPVFEALRNQTELVLIETGQHSELIESTAIDSSYLEVRRVPAPADSSSMSHTLGLMVQELADELRQVNPSLVLVQGDTNSALAGALAARYLELGTAHVEAGLRTHNPRYPWPEELNRRLIGQLADLHFAPTTLSRENLISEGIDSRFIFVTGNTAVDVVEKKLESLKDRDAGNVERTFLAESQRILVTMHRRESHGIERRAALVELMAFLDRHPEFEADFILHPNPAVLDDVEEVGLEQHPAVSLLKPQSHDNLLSRMLSARFIISDSGGIQEEAPSAGKTVFIARNETERPEAVDLGLNFLVGANLRGLEQSFQAWLNSPPTFGRNPYGDGQSGRRIAQEIKKYLDRETNG